MDAAARHSRQSAPGVCVSTAGSDVMATPTLPDSTALGAKLMAGCGAVAQPATERAMAAAARAMRGLIGALIKKVKGVKRAHFRSVTLRASVRDNGEGA